MAREMSVCDINPYVRFARILLLSNTVWDVVSREVKTRDCRLFYCIRGKGEFITDGTVHRLSGGSLCILRPGTAYRWSFMPDETCEVISINFDYTQDYRSRIQSYHPENASEFSADGCHEPPVFSDAEFLNSTLWLENISSAEQHLRSMVTEKLLMQPMSGEIISHILSQVIFSVVRTASMSRRLELPDSTLVHEILAYIQSNYSMELTNNSIAEHFGFHPNYLGRIIKQATGQSLHRFVMLCRINAAKELLTSSELKISKIAQAVGFSDIPHFTRAFRSHTGQLPSDYAKQHTKLQTFNKDN